MTETSELMLVAVCVTAIEISIGLPGISYLVMWLKSKRTQSHKTKTEHTVSDSQDS
jgi:hypothetical protein